MAAWTESSPPCLHRCVTTVTGSKNRPPPQSRLAAIRLLCRHRYALDVVELSDVDADRSIRIRRIEHRLEPRAPHDLVAAIRGSRVNGLRERLIEAVQQDEELRFAGTQVVGASKIFQRTVVVDRMDDRPRERKERDDIALQLQVDELARIVIVTFAAAQQDARVKIDDLRPPLIDHAKHECLRVLIRRDHRVLAEHNQRRRPREPRKDDSGDEREGDDAEQRFDRHHHAGGERHRNDVAVADRTDGLDAEEKRGPEASQPVVLESCQRLDPAQHVREREHDIDDEIQRADEAEELGPREGEEVVVREELLPEVQPLAFNVETAVAIEQALTALARDDAAEAEIEIDIGLIRRFDLGHVQFTVRRSQFAVRSSQFAVRNWIIRSRLAVRGFFCRPLCTSSSYMTHCELRTANREPRTRYQRMNENATARTRMARMAMEM